MSNITITLQAKCVNRRHVLCCIPDIQPKPLNFELASVDSFSLGDALTSYFPLLEMVFQYLSAADVRAVKQVNSAWEELANRELEKRVTGPTYLALYNNEKLDYYCKFDYNFFYTNIDTSIFLGPWNTVITRRKVCVHPDANKYTFADYVCQRVLPPQAKYCFLESSLAAILPEKEAHLIYSSVHFPHIPKIRISVNLYKQTKDVPFSDIMSNDERARCLLFFSHDYSTNCDMDDMLKVLIKRQNLRKIAVGGGVVTRFRSSVPVLSRDAGRLLCISFLEDVNDRAEFDAFSVVITSGAEKLNEKFKSDVLMFKQNLVERRHGILLKFTCFQRCARECENSFVEKNFSDYRVLVLDVCGEFGYSSHECAYFDDKSAESPDEKKARFNNLPQTLHGFTTILVFITWGQKRTSIIN